MVNRKRTSVINLRVTPAEKERIERFAKKCRLSVSEYLRQLANGYAPRELPTELIGELQRMAHESGLYGYDEFQRMVEAKLNHLILACLPGRQEDAHGNH